jgi:hypothetical protein
MRKIILFLSIIIISIPLPFSIIKFLSEKEILKFSLFNKILKIDKSLSGVFETPVKPNLSLKRILNGSFQNVFERYFNYNMFGRPSMTRIYNQISYSIFNVSNNNNIFIGKEKYLYEPSYPIAYLQEPDENQKNSFLEKLELLSLLQLKIKEMGKHFFVIITPSKASFYPEYLPNAYSSYISMKNTGKYSQNYYDYLCSIADKTGLKYFDYHDNFTDLKKNGVDVFPKGGIHWTSLASALYSQEFFNYLNDNGCNAGKLEILNSQPVWGNAFFRDDDLEELLNIFPAFNKLPIYKHIFPRSQFYSYHIECLPVPSDYRPSVFLCGGSFNYILIYNLYGDGYYNEEYKEDYLFSSLEFSYYNSYILKFPGNIRISDTTDNFSSILSNDIIILEFNEQQLSPYASQFNFAKNLLNFIIENEQY